MPGVAQAEGQVKGAVASEGDLAIARYDALTAEEIVGRLAELSQIDLAKIDSYERKNQNRTTVLGRITTLRGNEPWAGYDELTAAEVQAVLAEGDDDRAAAGPLLRAQPQEPRRRPQGRRARARQRLSSWYEREGPATRWALAARWCQKPSWRSTADSLVLACSFTVRVTSWWPRLMVTL